MTERGTISMECLHEAMAQEEQDHILEQLNELSPAEWSILVALKRAQAKCPELSLTFEVLYDEYVHGFAASSRTHDAILSLSRSHSRTVLRAALDMLVARGIITTNAAEAGQTVAVREAIEMRIPLTRLPEWITRAGSSCPEALCKLTMEAL